MRVLVCVSACVCSDLHWALFDLVAARGVESRGLLEEELSGCLEGLRERIRHDQMFIVHAQSYSHALSKLCLTFTKKKKSPMCAVSYHHAPITSERAHFQYLLSSPNLISSI